MYVFVDPTCKRSITQRLATKNFPIVYRDFNTRAQDGSLSSVKLCHEHHGYNSKVFNQPSVIVLHAMTCIGYKYRTPVNETLFGTGVFLADASYYIKQIRSE